MDRAAKDGQALSDLALLLSQDRHHNHLSEEDLDKALKAVEHVVLVLTKHAVNIQISKLGV